MRTSRGSRAEMPSISQNRMRLARMTGAQALSAVRKPGGKLVTRRGRRGDLRFVAGDAELANAEVEPSLLSLICRELNERPERPGAQRDLHRPAGRLACQHPQ